MPAAIPFPSGAIVDSAGSSNLANAVMDPYDVEDAFLDPLPWVVAFVTRANPIPVPFPSPAIPATAHGHAWFEKIHVVPREKELGPVGSAVEFEVEVYNAFRARAKTMNQITVVPPAVGLTVVDHLGAPSHFAATQSELYTIQIAEDGDPVIDVLVTWIFIGIDPLGTNIRITGFRMIPFTFDPNMEQEIVEQYGYLTDVQEAWNGMEQRRQLREIPVGTIGYSLMHLTTEEAQLAAAVLFGNQARPFGVGRWQYQTPVTQPASIGDDVIFCDTTNLPFVVDGLVMIWSTSRTYETHKIKTVAADRITLTNNLELAWPVGAKVVPAVVGRLSQEETFSWESLVVGSQAVIFSIDGFKP